MEIAPEWWEEEVKEKENREEWRGLIGDVFREDGERPFVVLAVSHRGKMGLASASLTLLFLFSFNTVKLLIPHLG